METSDPAPRKPGTAPSAQRTKLCSCNTHKQRRSRSTAHARGDPALFNTPTPNPSKGTHSSAHQKPPLQDERVGHGWTPGNRDPLLPSLRGQQSPPQGRSRLIGVAGDVAKALGEVWFESTGDHQVRQGRLVPRQPAELRENKPDCATPSGKDRGGCGNRSLRMGLRATPGASASFL